MTKPAPLSIISSLTGIVACAPFAQKSLYRLMSFAALVAASAIAASTQIRADDIVYAVDQTIVGASATGTVTGTITVDRFGGPTGLLFNGDITDFNLTISVDGQTSTLRNGVNGGSVFIQAGGLSSTPSELLYNFGATGTFVNFFTSGPCAPIWTVRATTGGACNGVSGNVNSIQAVPTSAGGLIATVTESGIQTIAVPGPIVGAGLPGLIAALGALVAMARRRRKQLA